MPVRKRRQKCLRVSNLALLLVVLKRDHGSKEANGSRGQHLADIFKVCIPSRPIPPPSPICLESPPSKQSDLTKVRMHLKVLQSGTDYCPTSGMLLAENVTVP